MGCMDHELYGSDIGEVVAYVLCMKHMLKGYNGVEVRMVSNTTDITWGQPRTCRQLIQVMLLGV